MKNRIVLIDHHDNPPDDRVTLHLAKLGYELDWRRPVNGDALGAPGDDVAGSVLFGGAQNVDQMTQYPFLHDEVEWIQSCHARRIPLIGICLGGQLIAHALGGKVSPLAGGQCEFGYYRITPTVQGEGEGWMPQPLHVTQAHFYQFEPPPGATLLATGETCAHQAFRCGETTFALQFHPEVSAEIFRRWQDADWAFFGAPGAQTRERQDALLARHDTRQHAWLGGFLDRLFAPHSPQAARA